MLTKFDDYLIHQTPETLDHVVSGDRNFYDRYYFNCHDLTGDTFLVVAMGAYPNLNIIDAFATVVVRKERQYSVKASRELNGDRSNSSVGPIGVEVLDGLRKLRVWCEPNDWGLSFDLTFEGVVEPFEEPHFLRRAGPRIVMDYTRLTQTGRWSGTLTVDGQTQVVEPSGWWGARDHSWGIRPIGDPDRSGAPARDGNMGFYWNWSPIQFEDQTIMYTISEDHKGARWHEAAARLYPYGVEGTSETLGIVRHDLKLKSGTRIFDRGTVVLREPGGAETTLELEPLSLLGMAGAGYAYSEGMWRHAQYHGPLAVDGEVWDLGDPAVVAKISAQNETVCRVKQGDKVGYGIFEFILFGLYEPYGFKALSDVAR